MWKFRVFLGVLLVMSLGLGCRSAEPPPPDDVFSGARAYEHVKAQVEMGPRPAGSEASARVRSYVRGILEPLGYTVEEQRFEARTPRGKVAMTNVIAKRPGAMPSWIVLGAHYDTKVFDQFEFVGANDGASGVGAVLELARVLSARPLKHGVALCFFDGEEAVEHWSEEDSLYGSTHLVDSWVDSGFAKKVRSVFVLDMVGDRNLKISEDLYSHQQLRQLVQEEGRKLGYGSVFSGPKQGIEDDHLPFLQAGIPAMDVIGFAQTSAGVYPSYWHTADDTLDKVSAESLEAVGRTMDAVLRRLDLLLED